MEFLATVYTLAAIFLFVGLLGSAIDDPDSLPCKTRGIACWIAAISMFGFFSVTWPIALPCITLIGIFCRWEV